MEKPYADLHVHSFYSDGSMSPEEIVEQAVSNKVGILAIADHNTLDGNALAHELCRKNGIHYIPAVELVTATKGKDHHILAYGFNVGNKEFASYVSHTRFMLDEMSFRLIELMQTDYNGVSIEDFHEYTYDRRLGGWKALHYFLEKKIISSVKEGILLYPKYNVEFINSGFSTIRATAHRIKLAGGYSVLAHPGAMLDTSDIENFKHEVEQIISYGVDGIECYYPTHSKAITQACIDLCDKYDLLITAGSDCHGTFMVSSGRVGEMNILTDKLRLKKLMT